MFIALLFGTCSFQRFANIARLWVLHVIVSRGDSGLFFHVHSVFLRFDHVVLVLGLLETANRILNAAKELIKSIRKITTKRV